MAEEKDILKELAEIDTSPLERLTVLKAEIETLEKRLAAMEERRDKVAEAVYLRVRKDYETRKQGLEAESEPLRAEARREYVKLFAMIARLEEAHEAARLDREEVDFRHDLGEFDDAEYQRRVKEIEARVEAKTAAREEALKLRERFIGAFRSREELERPAAEATTPPPAGGAAAATTAERPRAPEAPAETMRLAPLSAEQLADAPPPPPTPASGVPTPPPRPAADPGATQTMQTLKGGAVPPRADQTVVIRSARLVPQNPEAGKITHTVGLKPVVLGSAEQCDVRIPGSKPQQAEIRASMAGYTISDLGGGVRINGVAVQQHLLRHEDVIEVGPARFLFRER